jgi:hypothetical protein
MGVLDLRTIARLADFICDRGGAYERSVRRLLQLLEGAGWQVEYKDGSRYRWLVDIIRAHNDDRDAIEALLRRLIDPREYDGGLAEAKALVEPLNALLGADEIEVEHHGARPVVRRPGGLDVPHTDQAAARVDSSKLRDLAVPGGTRRGVFLNYRRRDTGWAATVVADALRRRLGASSQVFLDNRSIGLGEAFGKALEDGVRRSGVLLALIVAVM